MMNNLYYIPMYLIILYGIIFIRNLKLLHISLYRILFFSLLLFILTPLVSLLAIDLLGSSAELLKYIHYIIYLEAFFLTIGWGLLVYSLRKVILLLLFCSRKID